LSGHQGTPDKGVGAPYFLFPLVGPAHPDPGGRSSGAKRLYVCRLFGLRLHLSTDSAAFPGDIHPGVTFCGSPRSTLESAAGQDSGGCWENSGKFPEWRIRAKSPAAIQNATKVVGPRIMEITACSSAIAETASIHLLTARRSGSLLCDICAHRVHDSPVRHVLHEVQQVHYAKVRQILPIKLLCHCLYAGTLRQSSAGNSTHLLLRKEV